VKLPWQKDPANRRSLAKAAKLMTAENGPDSRAQDLARGSAILEKHRVETPELGDLVKLPPFRPVITTLMQLLDRENVSNADIARLVESDTTLTAELLAVVNSPLFVVPAPVTDPAQAVNILGLDTTRSVVATLAMRCIMQGAPRTPVVRRFWVHSLASATIAQHFAPLLRVGAHEVYVGALLHDLGRLGLLAAHPEEYTALALGSYESTAEILSAEQARFGMTHCRAGALLAGAWSLSDSVGRVVEQHHEDGSADNIVAVVQLCCRLADDLEFPAILRRDIQKPEETVAAYAPEPVREVLAGRIKDVSAAILGVIERLDF
jgi:putative nucleotidyltransferase with HDIG domain